jgi:phosphatidylserine/phosphatidylglycerophosphate/cardiolipin synthase-like enzyme
MNIRTFAILICFSGTVFGGESIKPPECTATAKIELRYSPDGDCTKAIIRELDTAKSKILMLAYSFTSDPITQALIKARHRGVEVQAIIDSARLFEKSNCTQALADNRVTVYGDNAHAIQHQKVFIIDPDEVNATLILGSFNFTAAAEKSNAENVAVIRSQDLASAAKKNWNLHKSHSKLFAEYIPKEKPGFFDGYLKIAVVTLIVIGLGILGCLLLTVIYIRRKR